MSPLAVGPDGPRARVVHHIPGRLRLRLEDRPPQPARLHALRRSLLDLPGVQSVRVNAAAGSLVIRYAPRGPGLPHHWLQGPAAARRLEVAAPGHALEDAVAGDVEFEARHLARHSRLALAIVDTTSRLDTALREATDGAVDLKVLVPLAIGLAGQARRTRDRGTPTWLTLALFAFNAFVSLHRLEAEDDRPRARAAPGSGAGPGGPRSP